MLKSVARYYHAENRRRALWLPVIFVMGIAIYFALPSEPNLWALLAISVLLSGLFAASFVPKIKQKFSVLAKFRMLIGLALLVSLGLSWATFKTLQQQQIIITKSMEPQEVRGVIRNIERTPEGYRLTLSDLTMAHLKPEQMPSQIRISMRPKRGEFVELPPIGSTVEMMAGLLPPMGPALPGGFDFARFFYFNDIGAVGFGLPPLKVIAPPPSDDWWDRITNDFWSWRSNITDRIIRDWGPHRGPIIAGFITGDIRALPDEDFQILRASNLYHIVAISGEHMMVISGVVFLLLRWLALLSPWRHRAQMKTLAAVLTLIIVSLYVFVTGLPVSAIRAYIMIVIVLVAIILRRQTSPMRSLLTAALLMVIYTPEDLYDPGFQLSFSATIALIALIEYRTRNFVRLEYTRAQRLLNHLGTVMMASVVAELATTPFVLSQFNTISPYGILANTIATPLVSFYLMPLVALFFLLLPLGLSDIALWLMDKGIVALMWIAETVGHWPHSLYAFPSPPEWAVAVFALGLLWLCIWHQRWRYWVIPPMLVALISPLFVTPPDVLIGAQMKQIAFRGAHGYVLAKGKPNSMLPKIWANGVGEVEFPQAEKGGDDWRCDVMGCVATVVSHGQSKRIAFEQNGMGLADDCAMSDLVVTLNNGMKCDKTPLIDGDTLNAGGIQAIWLRADGTMRIRTASQWQKRRPWSGIDEE